MIVDNRTMQAIDERAQREFHIPGLILMETAGRRAWEAVRGWCPREARIVFVAGSGNNGGDAMVMMRAAREEGYTNIALILYRDAVREPADVQLAILTALERPPGTRILRYSSDRTRCLELLSDAAIIVDGLFGAGLASKVREEALPLIDAMNGSTGKRISVDVPSGLYDGWTAGEPAVCSEYTVVTGLSREILYAPAARRRAGVILRVDPGFPREALEGFESGLYLLEREPDLPAIGRQSHKGDRGRCLILAGSPGTGGAAILCAQASLFAGAGMVRLVSDAATCTAALGREPALMTDVCETVDAAFLPRLRELLTWADAVLIGPGWTGHSTEELVRVVGEVHKAGLPMILDAAALVPALLEDRRFPEVDWGRVVLTPHIGEFRAMTKGSPVDAESCPHTALKSFRSRVPATVVLKSAVTWVAGPTAVSVLDGACPHLGTAGSGDVLSGIVVAFLSRGLEPYRAATEAVLVHNRAGKLAARARGYYPASALLQEIGVIVAAATEGSR